MGEVVATGRVTRRLASVGKPATWRGEIATRSPALRSWYGEARATPEHAEYDLVAAARDMGGVELDPPLAVPNLLAGDLCLGPLGGEIYMVEDGPAPDKVVLKVPATVAEQEDVRQRLREEQAKALQRAADVAAEVAARGGTDVITSATPEAAPLEDELARRRAARLTANHSQNVADAANAIPALIAAGARSIVVVGFDADLGQPIVEAVLCGDDVHPSSWALLGARILHLAAMGPEE